MTSPISSSSSSDLRYRLFVFAGLAIAAGALVLAVMRTDTDDGSTPGVAARPDVVEQLIPRDGAEVLRQSELGIDLAPGYEGALFVNGVEIPAGELRIVDAENQVFFTPGEGKVIEELDAGRTCVDAIVWRSEDTRGPQDQRFRWCFDVT